ncbi:protein FAR1-RELATED SEQUENCE 5 isoform X1 [Ziziphus jujuba]|uniref:Protein FAR1-RELATED SEQUENCE 5 isoform X1 n=1 Tax=Ziziphus jujuba TaxID=326968 RepID=A0A6P3ZQA0_ZIZJJ|nr:protein FAR1-RELATED SEQUENCE 5 isoform X1 [Ziziphus jujuba]
MDSELGEDIHDGVLDNSTDIDHELGNDTVTVGSSSIEETSHVGQNEEMTQKSSKEKSNVVEGDEPYVGQEFDTEEAAHAFYSAYGMRVGFVTRMNYLSRSKLDGTIIGRTLVCNKEGYRKSYRCDKQSTKPRTPTRVGCKAMLSIRKLSTGKWIVTKFIKEHTHSLAARYSQNVLISHQVPNETMKIQELTQQLLLERKRSASFRKVIDLLFNHIEEHTQDLSRKVQCMVDKVKQIESDGKDYKNLR